MQVVLPVGISFFTFQGMSYVIDVYRRRHSAGDAARHGAADELLPASGGRADRARVAPDPAVPGGAAHRPRHGGDGLLLIVWGLFKKAVIASQLATGFVDPVFFDPGAHIRA